MIRSFADSSIQIWSPRLALLLAVIVVGILQPSTVHAEINGGESIDWIVADSDLVVRGTLAEVWTTKGKNGLAWDKATVKVTETLKGKDVKHATFDVRQLNAGDAALALKKDGVELLFFLVGKGRYLSDDRGNRLKGTCLFFADRPGSVDGMAPLVKRNPKRIVAARIHAYAPDRLPPFGSKELRHLWETAADLGLAIQLHFEPRYAPGFEPLIKEFAETTIVIDHLGRPMQGTIKEHDVIVRWARFRNTVMKVSALPDQNRYPHRDVTPIVRKLTNAFGADRMIYGGGFNAQATSDSYRGYREQVGELLAHLSTSDRAKILGGTAAKLFGFSAK